MVITVTNVAKTYGKKQNAFQALANINFTIPTGASVAILGKSGSGKSTLMHVMGGLDHPDTGEIVVDEQPIHKLKPKKMDQFRAHTIGFIFQAFFVQANESCYDNVSLPLEIAGVARRLRKQKVEAALAAVELLEKKKSKARNLSGGQKQRLAIARAIVNQPKILFADEPTGNLDSATGATIERLLFGYNRDQGVTLIIVTHDPELAAKCDIRIHIKDGKIEKIEEKPPARSKKS